MTIVRISVAVWICWMWMMSPTAAFAQTGAAVAQTAASPGDAGLPKGSVELAVIGGTTLPVTWLRAHADRHLTLGALQVGRVLTHQLGRGPLAGSFEMLLEATPLVVIQQPASTAGVAASPLHLRWNFVPFGRSAVRWFAEASGGVILTSADVPVRTTRFNFIDQAGFGLRFPTGRNRTWLTGYRFQHISNAGRVKPNPGVNFNFLYAGLSFSR